jgi:hypothetical protein
MVCLRRLRYAAERKIARGPIDYWDYATLLKLAVLARDGDAVSESLASAWAKRDNIDSWSPESTAANLRDIKGAGSASGEDTASLQRVIDKLDPPKPA